MRALAIAERGASPAVLEVLDPQPGPGEVRVSLRAGSVNGFDIAVAAGRVWDQMPHEFPVVLGRDFAGVVDGLGSGVADLAVGDLVAGQIQAPGLGPGALGEHLLARASEVVRVPADVSAEQAAAVGLAATAALDAVDALEIEHGDTVLVAGATGGVGAYAVQIAAARGARVIGTARPGEEEDFVRRLGAAQTADYTGDLAAAVTAVAPGGLSKILHAAGPAAPLAGLLASGGRLASLLGATKEQLGRVDIDVVGVVAKHSPGKLTALLDHVAAGRLVVPIVGTYPLPEAAEALAAFRAGALGKIVVTA